jgi:hypothetical protein
VVLVRIQTFLKELKGVSWRVLHNSNISNRLSGNLATQAVMAPSLQPSHVGYIYPALPHKPKSFAKASEIYLMTVSHVMRGLMERRGYSDCRGTRRKKEKNCEHRLANLGVYNEEALY